MCEKCEKLQASRSKRGVYLCEFFPMEPAKERKYGPYAVRRCAQIAVLRGAIRSPWYTAPRLSARAARGLHNVFPPSEAPRKSWEESIGAA